MSLMQYPAGLGQLYNHPLAQTQAQNALYQQAALHQAAMSQYATMQACTTSGTNTVWVSVSGSGVTPAAVANTNPYASATALDRVLKIRDGQDYRIELPDGAIIKVEKNGSYQIDDKDAKIVYRANRMRDFNRFLNVSDRLEEFIGFCGEQGVRANEMLDLPIKLFIGWLVIAAAKADNEEPPDNIALLPDLRRRARPKCPGCGRFTSSALRSRGLDHCAPRCFERHYARIAA